MTAHSTRAHAKLSPSSAHRWIACPGSVRESAGIESKSSVFADEGTAAHTLGEACLRGDVDPATFLGGHVNIRTGTVHINPGEGDGIFEIDDEMVDAITLYVDTVKSYIEPGDIVEYEAKLDLTHIPGMEFGTGDCVIYKPAKRRLIVIDLKYGRGVAVYADENPQELTYALGASQRYHNQGVDHVECVIVQPRSPGVGDDPPGVRPPYVIEGIDLVEFRMELEAAAAATAKPDAPLNPGEWCRFCPAAPTCPALRAKVRATAEMEFADEPPVVDSMSLDAMAEVLKEAGVIRDWVKRVEERAHQMARDGTPPTGFKLVWSRATRKWRDEDAAKTYLMAVMDVPEDDIYVEPKMKSPAGLEKVVGSKRKAELRDLIVAKPSGTILVPTEDPRPAVKVGAEEEFA